MSLSLIFWLLMFLWVVFAVLPLFAPSPWIGHGSNLLLFVLFLILGWHAFGAPIK